MRNHMEGKGTSMKSVSKVLKMDMKQVEKEYEGLEKQKFIERKTAGRYQLTKEGVAHCIQQGLMNKKAKIGESEKSESEKEESESVHEEDLEVRMAEEAVRQGRKTIGSVIMEYKMRIEEMKREMRNMAEEIRQYRTTTENAYRIFCTQNMEAVANVHQMFKGSEEMLKTIEKYTNVWKES